MTVGPKPCGSNAISIIIRRSLYLGVMAVNKPIMDAEPVWVAAAKNK
jgi:hypothetical protein